MFHVTMIERDEIVGQPDARKVRQYPLASTDTLSHADTIAARYEGTLTGERRPVHRGRGEYVTLLIDRNHPHEYGNVYRTTYISVSVDR